MDCAQRDGDEDDRVDRRLETRGDAGQHGGRRAGAGRFRDVAHGRGLGGGEVLGEAAERLREHEADHHGGEHAPTDVRHGVGAGAGVVADVEQRDRGRADDGEDAGGEEAAVDGLQRIRLALLARTANTPTIEASTPIARDQREDQTEHPLLRVLGVDRVEGGDAEDDRGDEGDLVALEQVGGHAGTVTDVVAHVVGDRRRVAGVVLRDAGLDLAHQVSADVGRLGEDAATDSQEQGEQRAAEAEADEDGRCRVLEDRDDDRCAEQAQPDGEHAGHAAGAEGDLQGRWHRSLLCRRRRAHVALSRQGHPDVARESRHQTTGHERERAEDARRAERQRL